LPYKSDKQRKYFNANKGGKIPASVAEEYNAAEEAEDEENNPKTKRRKKVNAAFLRRMKGEKN
jgi:5,10-methylenetetrahydrofolate reductase